MQKVNLKEALRMLRIDQTRFAKEIKRSKETVSACSAKRLDVSEETKERMIDVLNSFREADIKRLEKEIRLLKNLQWNI